MSDKAGGKGKWQGTTAFYHYPWVGEQDGQKTPIEFRENDKPTNPALVAEFYSLRAIMAKCDIQSAFCSVLIHPADFCLLGFKFSSYWYTEEAIFMVCSDTCVTFEAFSSFLEWPG